MKLLDPRCLICLEQEFFSKTIQKSCFPHSYLCTFKKSKSHINTFMKLWQRKSTKLRFDKSIFSHNLRDNFSQTCSFCWILKDHVYFHFTLCQTKIMSSFSQKVQKTLFWGHFYYCRSRIPWQVSEKNMSIPRKITDGWSSGHGWGSKKEKKRCWAVY